MKAERRQELRTNELSQQIDHVGEYFKQNATLLTSVVLIAAVIVGGAFWYVRKQQSTVMTAWAALAQRNPAPDAPPRADVYREVANDNLDPVLTVQAWLRVAEAAMQEMVKAKKPDAPASDKNWPQVAEEAFNKVISIASKKDVNSIGQAYLGLGVLAENKGDLDGAAKNYRKIADDKDFDSSPVKSQATYRLENMKNWSTPVVFPPPPPPSTQPATTAPSIVGTSVDLGGVSAVKLSPDQVPESVRKAAHEAANNPTTQPAGH